MYCTESQSDTYHTFEPFARVVVPKRKTTHNKFTATNCIIETLRHRLAFYSALEISRSMECGRLEAKNLGKSYEGKLLSWISLSCLARKDVRDFWLYSNVKAVKKFDDIILHVEFENSQKEIYFVQVKYKNKDKYTFVVESLEGKSQKIQKYQEAFFEVWNDETSFLKRSEVDKGNTRMFFVLSIRQQLYSGEIKSTSTDLKLVHSEMQDFLKFSNTPSNCSYKLQETGRYHSEFLERFRIILNLFKDDQMEEIIRKSFGLNLTQTTLFMEYIKTIFEPSKCIEKVTGIDIKLKLLDILYNNLEPPEICHEYKNGPVVLELMNSFKISKICRPESRKIVWQAIWNKLKEHCPEQYVTMEYWNKSLPLSSDQYENITNGQFLKKELNLKNIYFLLCIRSEIPFYIDKDCSGSSTNCIAFKMFSSTIIYDEGDLFGDHQSDSGNVLTNLNDLSEEKMNKLKGYLTVSFHGKPEADLVSIISDDPIAKTNIDTDLLLKLIISEVKIGKAIGADEIYVARKIKVPVVIQDVLKEHDLTKDYVIILCNLPGDYLRWIPNVRPLEVYLEEDEQLLPENVMGCNIFFWPNQFDTQLSKEIKKYERSTFNKCYVLEYTVGSEGVDCFVVKHPARLAKELEPLITHSDVDDKNLLKIRTNFNVNVICNSAGMGKTYLLRYLSRMFPLEDCAVYVDINNYSHISSIRDLNDLKHFFFRCLKDTTPKDCHDILDVLHELYERKRKFIWLIDDYEEIHAHSPVLLDLLKNISDDGVTVWLTSRKSLQSELESKFNTRAMEIRDFNEKDVRIYFDQFFAGFDSKWIRRNLDLASAALKHSAIGNCQKTMMLAVIFKSNTEEIELDCENKIYRKFVENEIERFDKDARKIIQRTLSKLALYHLFTRDSLMKILYWEEFNDDLNFFRKQYKKNNIVTEIREDCTAIFNHKTYAEYLAAQWLAEKVQKQIKGEAPCDLKGLVKTLYLKELTTVRSFFDSMILDSTFNICMSMENWKNFTSFQNVATRSDVLGRSIHQVVMSNCQHETYNITDNINQFLQIVHKHCSFKQNCNTIEIHVPVDPCCNASFSPKFKLTEEHLQNKDLIFGYNMIEFSLLSGSLCYLNALLEHSSCPLPEISEDRLYFILLHSIVHDFTSILKRLDLPRLNCLDVRVNEPMESLLHLAVQYEKENVVEMLLALEDDLDKWGVDKRNNTVLHALFLKDYIRSWSRSEIVKRIFAATYSVKLLNQQNSKRFTVLHYLCQKGLFEYIKQILRQPGIDIDAINSYEDTPLKICVKYRKLDIAKHLISKGADVNLSNRNEMTILHYSVLRGDLHTCKFLVTHGANIEARSNYGIIPLMLAASRNNIKILTFLLSKKAVVNEVDDAKWSALHHAINKKNEEIVEILLENGADINLRTKSRQYPIMMACRLKSVEITKMLLDRNPTCAFKKAYKIAKAINSTDCMSNIRLFLSLKKSET